MGTTPKTCTTVRSMPESLAEALGSGAVSWAAKPPLTVGLAGRRVEAGRVVRAAPRVEVPEVRERAAEAARRRAAARVRARVAERVRAVDRVVALVGVVAAGRSRPSLAESAATDSGVALSPSITSAALPGRTSRTVKTTTDAASKVSSRLAKRLKRKKLMAVARRAPKARFL